jgi:hypothetical protein
MTTEEASAMTMTLAPIATVVTATTSTIPARKHQPERTVRAVTGHVSVNCPRIVLDEVVACDVPLDSPAAGLPCDYCSTVHSTFVRDAAETDERPRDYGTGTGRRSATPKRTNRYGGRCTKCGAWVEAEAGLLTGHAGAWTVEHDGECPVVEPAPAPVAAPVESGPTPEGMHRLDDGRIFKVQVAHHGSGNLYAKLLVLHGDADAEFVYAPGAIKLLSAETLMSLDDARAFGALYGVCCNCGATLTDEDSIRFGIGPVCGGRVAEWSTGHKLTTTQVKMLMSLPVPAERRTARTAAALVSLGLARIVDGEVVAA